MDQKSDNATPSFDEFMSSRNPGYKPAAQPEAIPSFGDFKASRAKALSEPKPNTGLGARIVNTGQALGRMAYDMPGNIAGYAGSLAEGSHPLDENNWADTAVKGANQRLNERMTAQDANDPTLLGTKGDWAQTGSSIPFSVGSMGAGMAAGALAGAATLNPAVGYGARALAAGAMAHRADSAMFVRNALDGYTNKYQQDHNGAMPSQQELLAEQERLQPYANEHGLWEAVPEGVGSAIGGKLVENVFKPGGNILTKGAKAIAGIGAEELPTETITQHGQNNTEIDAGVHGGEKRSFTSLNDLGQSLGEVAMPVLQQSLLMGGGAAAVKKAYDYASSGPLSRAASQAPVVQPEPTINPLAVADSQTSTGVTGVGDTYSEEENNAGEYTSAFNKQQGVKDGSINSNNDTGTGSPVFTGPEQTSGQPDSVDNPQGGVDGLQQETEQAIREGSTSSGQAQRATPGLGESGANESSNNSHAATTSQELSPEQQTEQAKPAQQDHDVTTTQPPTGLEPRADTAGVAASTPSGPADNRSAAEHDHAATVPVGSNAEFSPTHKLNDGYDTPVVKTEDGYQDAEGFSYAPDEDATPINEYENTKAPEDTKVAGSKKAVAVESQKKPAEDEAGNLLLQQTNERPNGVLAQKTNPAPAATQPQETINGEQKTSEDANATSRQKRLLKPKAPEQSGAVSGQGSNNDYLAGKGFTPSEINEINAKRETVNDIAGWARGRFGYDKVKGVDFNQAAQKPIAIGDSVKTDAGVVGKVAAISPSEKHGNILSIQTAKGRVNKKADKVTKVASDDTADNKSSFTIDRVENDTPYKLTFAKGDDVKVAGSFPMKQGKIIGLSKANKQVNVGGVWYDYGYVYKNDYDEYAAPRKQIDESISRVDSRLNDGHWTETQQQIDDIKKQVSHFKLSEYDNKIKELEQKKRTVEREWEQKYKAEKEAKAAEELKKAEAENKRKAEAKPDEPVKMTMKEWSKIHRDFKGKLPDGTRSVYQDGRIQAVEIVKPQPAKPNEQTPKTSPSVVDKQPDKSRNEAETGSGAERSSLPNTKAEEEVNTQPTETKPQDEQADKVVKLADKAESDNSTTDKEVTEPEVTESNSLIEQHKDFFNKVNSGEVNIDQFKNEFEALVANKDAVEGELAKQTKAQLLDSGYISYYHKNEKKDFLVRQAYRGMQADFFISDSLLSYGMGKDSYINAIRDNVQAQTESGLKDHAEAYQKAKAERDAYHAEALKGMDDPKTLEDYQRVMRSKMADGKTTFGEARMSLTPEQREQYDSLAAEKTRGDRKARADQQKTEVRSTVQTTSGDIVETKHTKTGEDLFVVKTADRVERDIYNQWNATAKRLGGWYSSFRGAGAVPGFQFKTKDNAEAFLQYLGGDVTQAKEAIQERRNAFADDKSQTAVERLTEMADKLEDKASNELNRDRKTNTVKRAGEAARAEANARADEALAKTMRNIASAIESGKAKLLDRVRQKVQVELLQSLVHNAHYTESTKKADNYGEQEKLRAEAPTKETADYVEYPNYAAYRSDLASLGRALLETDGTKKLGQQILSVADDISDAYLKFAKENLAKVSTFRNGKGDLAAFKSKSDAGEAIIRSGFKGQAIVLPVKRNENLIILSPSEAVRQGIWKGDNDKRLGLSKDFGAELVEKIGKAARKGAKISVPWQFESAYEKQKRLSAMGIETPAELRAAVREFIALREAPKEEDKIKKMERAMIGRANDGLDFFPTPASVADEMVEAADIKDGMSVLEPSAGMGHIAERIRESGVEPDVVELSNSRKELLEAKGFNVIGRDFMDVTGSYDRIIMNPPFSDRRDMEHVQHAYDLLNPGGRLVAIMGEGVFFGSDKKAQAFRDWLEERGGTDEKLEEGTFNDPSLPVNTGVNARMVVIDKPESGDNRYSKSTPVTGSTVADIKKLLPARVNKLVAAGKLDVVQSADMLPDGLKHSDVEALYDNSNGNDTIYLVADMLNKDNILPVTFHELIHRGEAQDPKLKAVIDRFESDLSRRFDLASRNIGTKAELAAYKRVIAAETPAKDQASEFRAYLVSDWMRSPDSFTGKVKQVFADFIASIRAFLIRNGADLGFIKSLTPADLAALSKYGAAVHRQGIDNKILSQLASVYKWEGTAHEYDQQFYDGAFSEDGKKPGARFENKYAAKDETKATQENKDKPDDKALYSRNGSNLPDKITIDGKVRSTLNSNGKPIANTEEGIRNFWKWFAGSKAVDAEGRPIRVYHGTASDFSKFDVLRAGEHGERFANASFFTSDPDVASGYSIRLKNNAELQKIIDKEGESRNKWSRAALDDFEKYGKVGSEEYNNVKAEHDAIGEQRTDMVGRINSMQEPTDGANLIPSYLSLRNPVIVDAGGKQWFKVNKAVVDEAIASGADGAIIRNVIDSATTESSKPSDIYIAFSPNQIKSAIGNTGSFSQDSNDIRYSKSMDSAMDDDPSIALNKRIREQHKTISDRAKQLLKREFSPGGLLPKQVFDLKINRDSEMNAEELVSHNLIASLDKAVKAAFGTKYENLTKDQQDAISARLRGEEANLPQAVKDSVDAMRLHIDKLSGRYAQTLFDEAKQLEEEGKDAAAQAKAELLNKIAGNIGKYVNRSYRAFDDKNWARKVPDEVLNNAREYFAKQFSDKGSANPMGDAQRVMNDILKTGTAYDTMEQYIKESKLGAKDLSVLIKRKEIAPEVRALLGEYTDARINFVKSATKMSRLIFNDDFLKKVKSVGLMTEENPSGFLFEENSRPSDEHTVKIAADSGSPMAPLNGLYTYPEINQAFTDALNRESMEDWYKMIVQANGLIKYGKTVLSPTTAVRNWMSAYFFTMANAHFDMSHMKEATQSFKTYFDKDNGRLEYLKKLIRLGVLYDTPYAGEMMSLLEDSKFESALMGEGASKLDKAKVAIKDWMDIATKFYRFGDDFWKIIGFENEKQILMKYRNMSEAEAETEAAKRIRDTYPTYTMVGRAINKLRRFPLVGTFVSFPAEVLRTSYNMLKYAQEDMKYSKELGRRRIAGLAMVSSFAFAAQALAMSLSGMDDDEEEALRDLAPSWSKNSNIVPLGRDKDGSLIYLDLSFIDPYNYFKRPLNAILRGQPIDETVYEVTRELLTPFFGQDIGFSAVSSIWQNKKESGGRVFNPNDSIDNITLDIANHLRKSLQPGIVSNIERMADAITGYKSQSGKVNTVTEELAALVGFRASRLNPKVALYYKSYEFQDKLKDASSILNEVARDPNKVSDSSLKSAYERARQTRSEAFKDMHELVNSARKAGLDTAQIRHLLKLNNVSSKNISYIMLGNEPKWNPGSNFLQSSIKKSNELFDSETTSEFVKRRKMVLSE